MKFLLTKTSESHSKEEIEINTLEELMKLMDEFDEDIVIHRNYLGNGNYMVEVYDDYRE